MASHERHGTVAMWLPWRRISYHVLCFVHFQVTCSFLAMTLTLMSTQAESHESTNSPAANLSEMAANFSNLNLQTATSNASKTPGVSKPAKNKGVVERNVAEDNGVPQDSPTALVIAASIAAVSILVFFVLAYIWHTHQLDSRARKLAIQLAADAETGMRCRSRGPPAPSRYPRGGPRVIQRPVSVDSSQEQNHYEALTPEDERAPGSDCGRSSVGVSESENGDAEDVFEPIHLPPIGERGRGGARGGRGAHRKWSRSRKSSHGANLDKRDSAVTDKDILTHFASRRHSTFFI